ncbi:hypothetical protein LshimejAT787_0600920 [Lyophyllum shimeji]|uniref:Uncharacterized protein n=1 Tax=Lyophyllum shimeji TaxID=47721 RepID=A0A9P3PN41_LYOSH|nr:hypothetical protein LshimejAT787_0600920 [Lyophyllum shimeji]
MLGGSLEKDGWDSFAMDEQVSRSDGKASARDWRNEGSNLGAGACLYIAASWWRHHGAIPAFISGRALSADHMSQNPESSEQFAEGGAPQYKRRKGVSFRNSLSSIGKREFFRLVSPNNSTSAGWTTYRIT